MIAGLTALVLFLPANPSAASPLPKGALIAEGPKSTPRPAPPAPSKPPAPPAGPAAPAPPAEPEEPALQCKLLTAEAPRGGRVEVEGGAFGKTPVVRVGGRVVRLLERSGARIAVQIPRDSDGGPVTVDARGQQADCGALIIVGKN